MKLSIAMATYNGERFLKAQLNSFLQQSRLPDELIVCDDCSVDGTWKILRTFKENAPFRVHIYRNEGNIGFIKNFEKALSFCSGDIIFLSDQDDVWFEEKLFEMEKFFEENLDVMIAINDLEIVDKNLQPTGFTKYGQIRRAGFSHQTFLTGCATAIRFQLLKIALPIPESSKGHDIWLHKLGNLLDRRQIFPKVLQYYRRHEKNVSAAFHSRPTPVSPWTAQVLNLKGYLQKDLVQECQSWIQTSETALRRLDNNLSAIEAMGLTPDQVEDLKKIEQNLLAAKKKRAVILRTRGGRRLLLALKMLFCGHYHKHFSGVKSFVKDLLLA